MPNIIEITDFHAPELDPYARLTQNQLRNRLEPEKGIFIAESPKVIDRALDAGYKPVSLLMERKQITGPAAGILSRCGDAPVYTADREMFPAVFAEPPAESPSTINISHFFGSLLSQFASFPLLSNEYFCFVKRFVFAFSSVLRIFAAFSALDNTVFKTSRLRSK